MSGRWSSLQREYYLLLPEGLDLQLQCRRYRMDSCRGSTDLPRYWMTLGQEILWDYPRQFRGERQPGRADPRWYPYTTDVPDLSRLLRRYIDTPKQEVLEAVFEEDVWGLTDLLKASDKRIGKRRLPALRARLGNPAARRIIDARLQRTRETPPRDADPA